MNLDDLLSAGAPETAVPEGFLAGVHRKVEQRKARKLLRDTMLLSIAIAALMVAMTAFLTNAIALQSIDFASMILSNPFVLMLEEGRMALLEMVPVYSLIFVVGLVGVSTWLSAIFVRDVKNVLVSLSLHATS